MSLHRRETPCDFGDCLYSAEYFYTCEHWCGADEDYVNIEEHDEIWGEEELDVFSSAMQELEMLMEKNQEVLIRLKN